MADHPEQLHGDDTEAHPTVRTYLLIWLALMVLLVATVFAAFHHLGALSLLVAMAIAIVKALLVILFFMHVRYSNPLVWIFSGAAFLWFGILVVLTLQDYATRGWLMWQ